MKLALILLSLTVGSIAVIHTVDAMNAATQVMIDAVPGRE